MSTKKNIFLVITAIITVLLITIGISYAYFTANLTGGEETTTITVAGGTLNIVYNGGANINVANIIPSDNPIATKNFIVTGNNTTDVEMKYQISLVIETNTFSEEALKYKLISTNTDSNGSVAPSINNLTNIGTGSKTIKLGVGEFTFPTNGSKVHTYNLEIYFPNAAYNQNIDQGKEIKAYIGIKNYKPTLSNLILEQGGGSSAIEAKGAPDFSGINGTSGIYATEDDYGTSYYYRGIKEELNNNLIWGGFQWKVVRINGDGSIRIIYNGTEAQFNSSDFVNFIGANTQIRESLFNQTNYNDAKYVGYMYGGLNGVASIQRHGTISAAATYNETSTNIKNHLDNWYQTNILGKSFESQVVDNIFCNDRQLANEIGGTNSGPGYGSTGVDTYYAARHRLYSTKSPSLKCGLKNDRFTSDDTILGNGSLTYPVGLITADEAAMAGLVYDKQNSTNYLYTAQRWWVLSPFYLNSSNVSRVMCIFSTGALYIDHVVGNNGVRPVVSINSETIVTSDGTATNPYRVI